MSMSWTWCDCTPKYSEKCPGCKERAMSRPDMLVHLKDHAAFTSAHWHVDCLLNFLTAPRPPLLKMTEFTDDDLKDAMRQMSGGWGYKP